jgi:hypothetical protein
MIYYTSNFKGLNNYILSQLFFISIEEKKDFIDEFNKIIEACGINKKYTCFEFNDAISNYEFEKNEWLQFYRLIVDFDYLKITDNNGVILKIVENNHKKIDSYDDLIISNIGLHIADFNIKNKIKYKFMDIEYEEKLINDTLKRDMEYDYEILENYIFLAISFDVLGNKNKSDYYLDKIEFGYKSYRMSERVIGENFKLLGEHFFNKKEMYVALKWLELGIGIFPKLGVKRLINEIKLKLNEY